MHTYRIHYATSFDNNPICEKCGKRIQPGLTHEPYTRTISIWLNPPTGFYPCLEDYTNALHPTGSDDRPASPSTHEDPQGAIE